MYKVISDLNKWSTYLMQFNSMDIYFTPEYFKSALLIDEGEACLFYFENDQGKVAYPFLKRKIKSDIYGSVFDITTPYGYGGQIYEIKGDLRDLAKDFNDAFLHYCNTENIISEFIRFHPLIENQNFATHFVDCQLIRHTLSMNLDSNLDKMDFITSKAKNHVRQAIKNNIVVDEFSIEDIDEFIKIYTSTMDRKNATNFYYFEKDYFIELFKCLDGHIRLFGAKLGDKIIAMNIILNFGENIHYHLSGSYREYLNMGVNNLLLLEVADYYCKQGYENFHLGGGYEGDKDSLYRFKKTMSKREPLEFYVGKRVHNNTVYNDLIVEKGILEDTNYFPKYRYSN